MSYIGRVGIVSLEGGLKVQVRVTDAKVSYGKLKLLVEPESRDSSGQMWVEEWRVKWEG